MEQNRLTEFIHVFTEKDIGSVTKIGRRYYLASNDLIDLSRLTNNQPDSLGVLLGEDKKDRFYPSLALIGILSKVSDKKVFIDSKSEWLFLCGRDIMAGSVMKSNSSSGMVLVQNEKGENLGLGKIVGKIGSPQKTIVIKNIIDRGDYLRREMD